MPVHLYMIVHQIINRIVHVFNLISARLIPILQILNKYISGGF